LNSDTETDALYSLCGATRQQHEVTVRAKWRKEHNCTTLHTATYVYQAISLVVQKEFNQSCCRQGRAVRTGLLLNW